MTMGQPNRFDSYTMLDDTSISSLYNCLNPKINSKAESNGIQTDSNSPSTSIVNSTAESSTYNYDSITIDRNDSSYYSLTDNTKEDSFDKLKRGSKNEKGDASRICKGCDNFIREIASLKEQLYYDWNKRVKPLEDSLLAKQDIIDCYKKDVEIHKSEISKWKDKVAELEEQLMSAQSLVDYYSNAVLSKQKECENANILLESALTSLDIEREKNKTNINYKNFAAAAQDADELPDIADKPKRSAYNQAKVKSIRRYETRSSTNKTNSLKSIDTDIFN